MPAVYVSERINRGKANMYILKAGRIVVMAFLWLGLLITNEKNRNKKGMHVEGHVEEAGIISRFIQHAMVEQRKKVY